MISTYVCFYYRYIALLQFAFSLDSDAGSCVVVQEHSEVLHISIRRVQGVRGYRKYCEILSSLSY